MDETIQKEIIIFSIYSVPVAQWRERRFESGQVHHIKPFIEDVNKMRGNGESNN